jgi:hypothetical protein
MSNHVGFDFQSIYQILVFQNGMSVGLVSGPKLVYKDNQPPSMSNSNIS